MDPQLYQSRSRHQYADVSEHPDRVGAVTSQTRKRCTIAMPSDRPMPFGTLRFFATTVTLEWYRGGRRGYGAGLPAGGRGIYLYGQF